MMVVDDEPLALKDLVRALRSVRPGCEPHGFSTPRAALAHAQEHVTDVAFLDIEMPGMSGLTLAKKLKDAQPDLHIVFVTSYEQYALDAFALHATGYLLKPVQESELERELTFIYGHRPAPTRALIRVQTFGGFEAFASGEPLAFKRSKTKELLALLVDRRGAALTSREACAVLWEDEPCTASQRSYYQSLVADLRATLEGAGAGDALAKSWNSLAIDPAALDCDSYRFLDGDPEAVNSYRGTYLPSYSWAEFSTGPFRSRLQ